MREQDDDYLRMCRNEGCIADKYSGVFGKLRKVLEILLPDIELNFTSPQDGYVNCNKNGSSYHINAMSEGEKAIIYYATSVLMAKENSFIIVDEPETYLNPSMSTILWDLLIRIRDDCQFIFITHSVDFVLGRSDAEIFWIKNFKYPNEWEFEAIEDKFILPKQLMTEILGSKKEILFCEGEKISIDYRIYEAVWGDKYTIIPVGGHLDVIKCSEVLQKSQWIGIECRGIVDGDNYSSEQVESLRDKGIIVLPVNEIEMLLLTDEVLECCMKGLYPIEFDNKIREFKEQFWETVEKESDKIVLNYVANQIHQIISDEKIGDRKSLEGIKKYILEISTYDIDTIYEEKKREIGDIIHNKDYSELLRVCNLKKLISGGLANKYLDNDYVEKALQRITTDEELQNSLVDKYLNI